MRTGRCVGSKLLNRESIPVVNVRCLVLIMTWFYLGLCNGKKQGITVINPFFESGNVYNHPLFGSYMCKQM